MNIKKTALFAVLITNLTHAQYEIKRFTINSGGSKITGGQYQIQSSIAQVEATGALTGDNYSLNGGFWHQQTAINNEELIFKNDFE